MNSALSALSFGLPPIIHEPRTMSHIPIDYLPQIPPAHVLTGVVCPVGSKSLRQRSVEINVKTHIHKTISIQGPPCKAGSTLTRDMSTAQITMKYPTV